VSFRTTTKAILRKILTRFGFAIVPESLVYDWQIQGGVREKHETYLPEGAEGYLQPDNPHLVSLQQRYQKSDYPSDDVTLWTEDRVSDQDMVHFRGHNAYLFQEGRFNRNLFGYLLAYYFTKSLDGHGLLNKLEEDTAFGAITYMIDERLVSRDLLDSVLEIYFLDRHLGVLSWKGLRVLDIGAGYGRLAHRLVKALPEIGSYNCTDAVPVSSFIAEYYLQFRKVSDKARVIHLDEIKDTLRQGSIDLAVNIHSFSECSLVAIEWWLDFLREIQVPHLMIEPNSGSKLLISTREDFAPLLERYGYRQRAMESKYPDPLLQKYALNPDHYHLYALQ
jgi:SAM-dependent methyltransferase